MAFHPDSRNLGGRKEIVDMLNNHHLSLLNMKATMHTRGHALRFVRAKSGHLRDEFKNVRATFQAVKKVKGGTDSTCPKGFALARKFHSMRGPNYHLQEHNRNTRSLQRRLLRIGSMTERKKNPYDPIANPALFFRKPGEADRATSLLSYAKRIRQNDAKNIENNLMAFQTLYSSPARSPRGARMSTLGSPARRNYRSATASHFMTEDDFSPSRSPMKRFKPQVASSYESAPRPVRRESQGGGILIPVVPGNGPEAYSSLQKQMVDVIIEHRLFREQQLEAFFQRCQEENVHLERDKVSELCEAIKVDLNS